MEHSADTVNFTAILLMAVVLAVFLLIYSIIYKRLLAYTSRTHNKWDNFMLDLFKFPLLWLLVWLMLKLFANLFLKELTVFRYLMHANNIVLIFSVGWILMKFVKLGAYMLQRKLDITVSDNLHARRRLTQLSVFQNIANTIIVIITISLVLMTFEGARIIGKSLLTSAGIAGIIIGFAAQKSIGMFLAGIQIAITQPISLDDTVTVEGEFGRVEEITLTYVVVKLWDERRLMLPVTYFLEKPFFNWTRGSADILGTVHFFVAYDLPVDPIRAFVPTILKDNPNWDGRVFNVQITNAKEFYKELRILVSSRDSSKNWDLRVEVREKVIDFLQANYPDSFVKVPLNSQQTMDQATDG
ncbi:MAG TPA: mechanosensitive ion channel domain-containing protein [Prolixibacteraceae bacterium]|nr:mechanosensitive ion channel domain-containing protein [Prolixibacteraceae bacterium]